MEMANQQKECLGKIRTSAALRLSFDCSLVHTLQIEVTDSKSSGKVYTGVRYRPEISLFRVGVMKVLV